MSARTNTTCAHVTPSTCRWPVDDAASTRMTGTCCVTSWRPRHASTRRRLWTPASTVRMLSRRLQPYTATLCLKTIQRLHCSFGLTCIAYPAGVCDITDVTDTHEHPESCHFRDYDVQENLDLDKVHACITLSGTSLTCLNVCKVSISQHCAPALSMC